MKTNQDAAERLATGCFLNSFLREQPELPVQELPDFVQKTSGARHGFCLRLQQLPEYAAIWIPLRRHSIVGRHRFAMPLFCSDHRGQIQALDLMHLAEMILREEQWVGSLDHFQSARFLQRLWESRETIEESLLTREGDIEESHGRNIGFLEAEQLLIAGHSFHPTPKSRDEFTAADRSLYSPEMGGKFPMAWVMADARSIREQRSRHFHNDWIEELRASDPKLSIDVPEGMRLLPLHPWQAEHLKRHPALLNAIERGDIRFLEVQGSDWHPTSSLRSLYRPEAPYMLKFSLSLKLTNSVRHLLLHEVERGLQVYDVLASKHGQEFLQRQPLHIMREPAFAMLLGEDGEPIQESIVVCRENPIQPGDVSQPLVLATLTQEEPLGRDNMILQHIKALASRENLTVTEASRLWFRKFCQVALAPFMMAQADFGILLGAHQQNMLLSLKDHLPEQVYFRDCQGTGYSEWACPMLMKDVHLDPENGNILPHAMESALFLYYLVINTSFNVIAAIADGESIDETDLLQELKRMVEGLIQLQPRDSHLLQDLLRKETLMHKGNFKCSIQSINENTSANPLSLYAPIRNPLYGLTTHEDPLTAIYQAPGEARPVVIRQKGSAIFAIQDDQTLMEFTFEVGRLSRIQDSPGSARDTIYLRVIEYVFGHNPTLKEIDCSDLVAAGESVLHPFLHPKGESRRIVDREAFFQYPPLWHRRQEPYFPGPERWTSTDGRAHPQRTFVRPGVLYRRYLPRLGRTISFELFDRQKHLDVFHEWQNQPRVAMFWDMAHSKAALDAYIEKMEQDPHQRPIVALLDDRPLGYFEVYWTPEDRLGPYYDYDPFDRGFHFLIGDVTALGKATEDFIQSMVHFIFLDDPRTRRVMGEPRHDNVKVLRFLETIPGWVKVKEFDFPHKRAALIQIKREDCFAGGSL